LGYVAHSYGMVRSGLQHRAMNALENGSLKVNSVLTLGEAGSKP
jgi:hypothetical protein